MTFLALKRLNGGKLDPPAIFSIFFLDFSPVNSPDRCGGMPGDYFQVIAPFYRTKIRQKMMFLALKRQNRGKLDPQAIFSIFLGGFSPCK